MIVRRSFRICFEDCGVDFHAAGVDHRGDETGWLSFGTICVDIGRLNGKDVICLGDKGVEGADGEEGGAGAEADAFGGGDAYAETGV